MTDRLSSLPEPIIHQIMSLLHPRDATRMTILSRQILSICRSFPFLYFDYSMFVGNRYLKRDRDFWSRAFEFADHVTASLKRLTTDLERLSLAATPTVNMSEVVSYVLRNNVRELSCDYEDYNYNKYFGNGNELPRISKPVFPYSVLGSKSIRKLSLSGFCFEQQDLTIESPFMEELTLANSSAKSKSSCTTINISCPKLKTVKISKLRRLKKIKIHDNTAEALESFSLAVDVGAKFQCKDIVNLASCKSLKALELCNVNEEDGWFASNVLCLASLETLSLKFCPSLSNILMRSERLESLELEDCANLMSIDLDAVSLHLFGYVRNPLLFDRECKIDLTNCPNVREFTVRGDMVVPTGVWAPKFEFLKKLKMYSCKNLEALNVDATHLELDSCQRLKRFDIKAPNLAYFAYKGQILNTFPKCDVSTESVAEIRLIGTGSIDNKESLRNFLSSFGHSKKLSFFFKTDEPLIYTHMLRSKMISPLHQLRHLSIELESLSAPIIVLIDSLLWLVPCPVIVSITIGKFTNLKLKFYYSFCEVTVSDELQHEKHTTQCCTSYLVKCWRHNVKRVEIEGGFSKRQERLALERYLNSNANGAITVEHVDKTRLLWSL